MNFFKDVFLSLLCLLGSNALPYDNEYGPDYGNEWIMFIDDKGMNHTMDFSTLPTDDRGIMFGDAYFYLYTRQNNESEILNIPDDDSPIISKNFNSSNELKVIAHGWYSGSNAEWVQNFKDIILRTEDANVIIVDWSELADNPIYPWSACSTRYVGKRTAKLLDKFSQANQLNYVHLIGHSLGAHVMGYTGMFTNVTVDRITGLDPARPLFEIPRIGPNFRLDKSDAKFVDIIHTCGGIYGYKRSHGHADFYPNDGKPKQPGCEGVQQVIALYNYRSLQSRQINKILCRINKFQSIIYCISM
ncbi:hypothetical protein O3G_MSEX007956 [Manduca sexta]|uniref:Lipase domain-containing protein n=1 Tax=Manduca sexta TaxID=7130 RepID=A0A921Z8B1_MANSE|nr:hypothetical protein O3G_MSEX007956 [Manduca sexta]